MSAIYPPTWPTLTPPITVDGLEPRRAGRTEIRHVRRGISMVFQHANLVNRLSALENVLLGRMGYLPAWSTSLRRYPRPDRELAYTLLGRVGMADHAFQRADTLSGGEQQRVGIARALASSRGCCWPTNP